MSNNRTFFKKVSAGEMSLKDIFSDVLKKHTAKDSARVFIAGTELTTPAEADMLAGWQKPFLFARFFVICIVTVVLAYLLNQYIPLAGYVVLVGIPLLTPFTMLLLAWEMNIPRNISLMEVLKIVAVGGIMSLIATCVLNMLGYAPDGAVWAALTEEPAKLIIIYLLLKRKNRTYILEGVLLGMAVGTGFAIMETLGYVMRSFGEGMVASVAMLASNLVKGGEMTAEEAIAYLYQSWTSASFRRILYNTVYEIGFQKGLTTALVRAFNGIIGHGMYAALYGGGILMAKGAEPVNLKHLVHPAHLKYFAVSVLIHMLNNSDIPFPTFLGGYVSSMTLVKMVIAVFFFLPMLRAGVNQVVEATTRHNGGRVTLAVNRAAAEPQGFAPAAGGAQLECIAGPSAGQVYTCPEGGTVTFGRVAGKCDIALPGSTSVSGLHCSVSVCGGRVAVTDLNSTNGTYLGSQRLAPNQPVSVPQGAVIYLGGKSCAIRIR